MTREQLIYNNFYNIQRRSQYMTDQGGPFGFDIHFAMEVDYLVNVYNCDAIIETGSNTGDTTEFLAKMYPDLPVITCEIDDALFEVAKERLQKYSNVSGFLESSEVVIDGFKNRFNRPFYYLDAHGYEFWPLADEVSFIDNGIVCVSDFKISNNLVDGYHMVDGILYGHDIYNGVVCDKKMIEESCTGISTPLYVNNTDDLSVYKYPSLQMTRRTGRCYFGKNVEDHFKENVYFKRI
jgi:hypothetical protein